MSFIKLATCEAQYASDCCAYCQIEMVIWMCSNTIRAVKVEMCSRKNGMMKQSSSEKLVVLVKRVEDKMMKFFKYRISKLKFAI